MKFKSILKFGLPAIAVGALAISLPLALTSCSDSSSSLKFDQNLQSSYQIVNSGEDFKLEVKMSGNENFGYQWYYKEVTNQGKVSLTDDSQTNISVPNSLKGFTAIKGENKNTLTIEKEKFNDLNNHEVEFACAIYDKDNTSDYVVSNVATISVAEEVETTKDQVNNLVTNSKTLFANKVQFMEDVESNGFVKKDSTTWNIFKNQLGFNSLKNLNESTIKTIQFVNVNEDTRETSASTETNVIITLNDGYTWSEELATATGDNNFSINENNALEIRDVTLPFDFEVDKNPKKYFTISDDGIITGLTEEGKKLQNIVIPNNPEITGIGKFAFSNSTTVEDYPVDSNTNPNNPNETLLTISIPSNIKTIDDGAFFNCSKLTNVLFTKDSQLTSIGNSAFKYTTNLQSIEIPASVTKIEQKAFHSSAITSVKFLGKNVETFGQAVFTNRSKLANVTLPSELTSIPDFTFATTTALKNLNVPSAVKTIGVSSFNKSVITTLDLSKTQVKNIANSAFAYTSSLQTIQLPKLLETIEINAFFSSGLTSISIPKTVTNISKAVDGNLAGSFQKCTSLASVTFEDNNSKELVARNLTIGQFTFSGCTSLTKLIFPSRTKVIEANAINGSGVKTVTFEGSGNPEIWKNTFAGTSSLIIYVQDEDTKTKLQSWFSSNASDLGVQIKLIREQSSEQTNSFFSTSF